MQVSYLWFFFDVERLFYYSSLRWSGYQIRIKQPMKNNSLRKVLAVLAKKNRKLVAHSWYMDIFEVREASQERLYLLQFYRKAWPLVGFLYHCNQLLAVCSKVLTWRVLKHILHRPSQRFYLRMQC